MPHLTGASPHRCLASPVPRCSHTALCGEGRVDGHLQVTGWRPGDFWRLMGRCSAPAGAFVCGLAAGAVGLLALRHVAACIPAEPVELNRHHAAIPTRNSSRLRTERFCDEQVRVGARVTKVGGAMLARRGELELPQLERSAVRPACARARTPDCIIPDSCTRAGARAQKQSGGGRGERSACAWLWRGS